MLKINKMLFFMFLFVNGTFSNSKFLIKVANAHNMYRDSWETEDLSTAIMYEKF